MENLFWLEPCICKHAGSENGRLRGKSGECAFREWQKQSRFASQLGPYATGAQVMEAIDYACEPPARSPQRTEKIRSEKRPRPRALSHTPRSRIRTARPIPRRARVSRRALILLASETAGAAYRTYSIRHDRIRSIHHERKTRRQGGACHRRK